MLMVNVNTTQALLKENRCFLHDPCKKVFSFYKIKRDVLKLFYS